ncbi:Fe(3+)-hydroxamate ABC transporter permease FhuB [Marinobacterium lutimaris]|uniref:Iron complex transport system permease protein n=1 Tax=Marinobacterium lutimaris TaxID=568106 RepID=A0A1H5YKL5_9GAMM|nr:Fe(3+)-hydroxamate ABC transporter permease FhuB [Marinobacterium lutimaris]SEG24260.1 iron complex transport system permease protein [Marinobacterium lutimaris]
MSCSLTRALFLPCALILAALLHLWLGSEISASQQIDLLFGATAETPQDFQFLQSALPRLCMALIIGATLGLAGSLLQQLTQNRLLSPMTLGTSSGAWLSLLVLTLLVPQFASEHRDLAALIGAGAATVIVFLLAGRLGFSGLPIVLSGMAINLLFAAIAAALILLNDQYAQPLFVWSSGDLAQVSWDKVIWLLPRLLWPLPLLFLAPRVLTLLRLGEQGARARGMNLLPIFALFLLLALWYSAVAVAAAGIVGFIGLLTPNLARIAGMRRAGSELAMSPLLGALLLTATDSLAMFASQGGILVPSGATAALIGAPMLVWLLRKGEGGQIEEKPWSIQREPSRFTLPLLILFGLVSGAGAIFLDHLQDGWMLAVPEPIIWQLRWPGVLTALSAGTGLAVAGVILQRLIRNPLASPDILGISAGATLAIIIGAVSGQVINSPGMIFNALAGSLGVLALLLLLNARQQFSPGRLAMIGISLAALMEACLQLVMTQGGDRAFALLSWMQGATYLVTGDKALMLFIGCMFCLGITLFGERALTLLSISETVARGRGLATGAARTVLLAVVGLVCALVTALVGPIAFIGLLAPHLASLLGARGVRQHLLYAALIGSGVMLLSEALSRTLIPPSTLPVGSLTSIIGGSYFVYLLSRRRFASA